MKRKPSTRQLDALADALKRATADQERAEADLVAAQERRDETIQAAAASAYLDESADYERERQKAEAALTEATQARDRALAAVEGLKRQGAELAEALAARAVADAEKEAAAAMTNMAQAQQAVSDCEVALTRAEEQLAVARAEATTARDGFADPEAFAAKREERIREHALRPDLDYALPVELRQAVHTFRQTTLREEHEAERAREREIVLGLLAAGVVIALIDVLERVL